MNSFSSLVKQLMESQGSSKKTKVAEKASTKSSNPLALDHWMSTKGKMLESIKGRRVDHPTKGEGTIVSVTEKVANIRWDRLDLRAKADTQIGLKEASYVTLSEKYKAAPMKAVKKAVKKADKKIEKKVEKKAKKKIDEAMAAIPMVTLGSSKKSFQLADDLQLSYADLYEEDVLPGESSDGVANYKSASEPLSTMAGADSAAEGGEDNFEMPSDSPDVPNFLQMEEPGTGNVRNAKKGGGVANKTSGSKSPVASSDSNESDDSSESDDSGSDSKSELPWEKKEKKDVSENRKGKKVVEQLSAEDVGLAECGSMGGMTGGSMAATPAPVKEHNMAAGEIAVTQALLVKILKAAAKAQLDDAKLSMIAQAVADCCNEDRTLDVEDIGQIQSKLQELVGGGAQPSDTDGAEDNMDADMDADIADDSEGSDEGSDEGSEESDEENEFEDKAEGDGEVAGPEGGEEHEGKTKLMAGESEEDAEEDEDEDEEKLNEFKGKPEDWKKKDDKKDPKKKEKVKEAWMAKIGGFSPNAAPLKEIDLDDEDAEIAMIKRRSGITK